ncbi:MAG: MFS transporter [Phycisphaerae bacterium]|nr:MFS transporter [Phycisphaerae bacterium]
MASDHQLTDIEKIRRLPWFISGNAFNSIFVVLTFTGSVFVLFLNELGLDKSRIGIIMSLVPFCQIVGIITASWGTRFGFKRIFLIFYGIRKFVMLFILLTPLIIKNSSIGGVYMWVVGVIFIFSISRSIAETSLLPWAQEIIPNQIRGKVSAANNIASTFAMMITIAVAGYVIGRFAGIGKFIYLIAGGIIAGIISLFLFSHLPGGRSDYQDKKHIGLKPMFMSLADRNYRNFLLGLGLATLALGSLVTFIPLYLKQYIGIESGRVVWIDLGTLVGSATACYLWGWACDRFGSKPVMIISLSVAAILPIFWFLMPRNSIYSVYAASTAAFILGVSSIGWAIGFSQYFYVTAVPTEKRASYMPVFYAVAGLLGGLAPLFAGQLLDLCKSVNFHFLIFNFDPYTFLFGIGLLLLILAIYTIAQLRPDGAITTQEFVGMMFQGNPMLAISNNVRYRWSGDEPSRVRLTERMGTAKTLLSSEELIEALHDPSFNVRHEAITAIGKLPAHPKLIDHLILILGGNQPDLALTAAWVLGKLGNKSAIIALRETLLSKHPLLQARSARALAMLGDEQSADFMTQKLIHEPDEGLKVAYASALGILHATQTLNLILDLLNHIDEQSSRNELALAVVRIIGTENQYVRFVRSFGKNRETAAVQLLVTLNRHLNFPHPQIHIVKKHMQTCIDLLSAGDWNKGTLELCSLCEKLLTEDNRDNPTQIVLARCLDSLRQYGYNRNEYILLTLHTIRLILNPSRQNSPS